MSFIYAHRSTPVTPVRSTLYAARRAAIAFAIVGTAACNSLLSVDNPGSVPAESLSDPALAPALAAAALQTLQCGVEQYAATAGMLSGEYLNANGFVDNHIWEWRSVVDIKAAPGSCNYTRDHDGDGLLHAAPAGAVPARRRVQPPRPVHRCSGAQPCAR